VKAGGRVEDGSGPNYPSRIYLKDQEYPGLCMTRSMGDCACKPIGVIH